jgi:hypothetical protein
VLLFISGEMSLRDRLMQNPNFRDRVTVEDILRRRNLEERERPPTQYKLYQLAIAAAPAITFVAGTTFCGGYYLLYTPQGQEFLRKGLENVATLFGLK